MRTMEGKTLRCVQQYGTAHVLVVLLCYAQRFAFRPQAAFAKAEEAAARAAGPAPSLPSFSGPSFMYAGVGAPPAALRGE